MEVKRYKERLDFEYFIPIWLFDEFGAHYDEDSHTYFRVGMDDFTDPNKGRDLQKLIDRITLLLKFEYLFSPHISIDPNWIFNNVPLILAYNQGAEGIRTLFSNQYDNFIVLNSKKIDRNIFPNFLENRYPKNQSNIPNERNSSAWLDMYDKDKTFFYNDKGPYKYLKFFVDDTCRKITNDNFKILPDLPGNAAIDKVNLILDNFDQFSYEAVNFFEDLFGSENNKVAIKCLLEKATEKGYLSMSRIRDSRDGWMKQVNEICNATLEDNSLSWFLRYSIYLPTHALTKWGLASSECFINNDPFDKSLFTLLQIPEKSLQYKLDVSANPMILHLGDRQYEEGNEKEIYSLLEYVNPLTFWDITEMRQRKYWINYRGYLHELNKNKEQYSTTDLFNQQIDILSELVGELILDNDKLPSGNKPFDHKVKNFTKSKICFIVIDDFIAFALGKIFGYEGGLLPKTIRNPVRKRFVTKPLGKNFITHQGDK